MIIVDRENLFTPEKAEKLVKELNETEDACGWNYKAKHDPQGKGYSFIEIYDENGDKIGKL